MPYDAQTVEDHILACAVIMLCNRMGTRLNEFGSASKRTISTAYQIAQARRSKPVFDSSKFVFGPALSQAMSNIADGHDKSYRKDEG